jgi:hypothetical protein
MSNYGMKLIGAGNGFEIDVSDEGLRVAEGFGQRNRCPGPIPADSVRAKIIYGNAEKPLGPVAQA